MLQITADRLTSGEGYACAGHGMSMTGRLRKACAIFDANLADNADFHMSTLPMPALITSHACPCGGPSLSTCCGPFLDGAAVPQTAEQLMRSRYSAYTLGLEAYLRATWYPASVPAGPIVERIEPPQWLGLEVKSALRLRQRKANLPEKPDRDTVEFVARYKINGRAHRLHEVSNFVRETGADGVPRWYYVDGSFPVKPGP